MRLKACVDCGAPVRYVARQHCCRCHRRLVAEARKGRCPRCGNDRALKAETGRCITCSRTCVDCGAIVRRKSDVRCLACRRRERASRRLELCPRCGRKGVLREPTGWCGICSRPRPRPKPPRECVVCGERRRHSAHGMCNRCTQADPDRPFRQGANLATRLGDPPIWLDGFVAHVAARHCVGRACVLITGLGRLLADGGPVHPQGLLERARRPGRSMGSLAVALQEYFVAERLARPLDQAERLAARRRELRLDATPEPLRPALGRFLDSRLRARERALRVGTRPQADRTIEKDLAIMRDFARFLVADRRKQDWSGVETGDVEAFLVLQPANAHHRLCALRVFFRWGRANKLVLVDPTKPVVARRKTGVVTGALARAEQKVLLARWSGESQAHPHERLVGILALLHGASSEELRALRVDDLDWKGRRLRLGRRPQPIPIDPVTAAALEAALTHREALRTLNPFVLVTKTTRTTSRPASGPYIAHILDAVGVSPKRLRTTRLLELVSRLDVKVVAEAFGLKPESVLPYLADSVDELRLADL